MNSIQNSSVVISQLKRVIAGESLAQSEMADLMRIIMSGGASPAQIAGLLVALRIKGETVDEITGAAQVMRELATPVKLTQSNAVDTCGTGGDGANLFNVSTAAAFVVAAAGGSVAKHGNRSVSSSTGSADLLEAAGANLALTPEQVARAVDVIGVGFLFAPAHHSAMKHAVAPRKELGIRTIFNLLGPMTNPAGVKRQVMGVFDAALCRPLCDVLQRLGSEHVLVVNAGDGLDEFSVVAPTRVAELRGGVINEYVVDPAVLKKSHSSLEGLTVASAHESLALIRAVFANEDSPLIRKAADLLALNAGAAIYVAGLTPSLSSAVAMADDAIASGAAEEKFNTFIHFTQTLS